MPRRNPRKEQLIAEVKRRERAAAQKIHRIQQRSGANIKGTAFDPRIKDHTLLQTMNARELKSHLDSVNRFVARGTQFVAAKGGTPIPKAKWEAFKSLEARNNARAAALEGRLENVVLPGSDTTVGMRNRMFSTTPGKMGDHSRIFQKSNVQPHMIVDAGKLDKYMQDLQNKNAPDYLSRRVAAKLNSLQALLEHSQNAEYVDIVRGLTLEQQHALVDYSKFGEIAADRFYPERTEVRREDVHYELMYGTSRLNEFKEALDKQLDWVRTNFPGGSSREYTDTTARAIPIQRPNLNIGPNAGPIPIQKPASGIVRSGRNTYTPVEKGFNGEQVYSNQDGKVGYLKKSKNGRWKFY